MFRLQTQLKGFERATLAMFRSDATEDYTADYITVGKQAGRKILLVWGTNDGDITRDMIQQIQAYVSPAKFAELKGVGHDPQVEVPDVVNGLIIDFINK
jgi:pimeloyl-ACP methyl ester carboxylesterase